MNKKQQALIIILSIVIISITLLSLDGIFLANRRLKTRQINIVDSKVDETLDGFKIVYFSDVHYNLFVDDYRLTNMVDLINKQKPDLVLLGGDLIDDLDSRQLTQQQTSFLIDTLKSINAHYGKFAVTGHEEKLSDYSNTTTKMILQLSEFEQIDNKYMEIHYQTSSFNLVGIGHQSDKTLVNELMNALKPNLFTLAFSHAPHKADLLNHNKVDLMVAGFTHGGQINIPLFKNVFVDSEPYIKNTQTLETMRLDISNGVGTDKIDMRMFADGDILLITLNKEITK